MRRLISFGIVFILFASMGYCSGVDALEKKIDLVPVIEKVIDTKGKTKSISIHSGLGVDLKQEF